METISNQAHVSFTYEGSDVVKTNNSNIVNSSIKDAYSMTVEKSSTTRCFTPGETINYMVKITNTGCGCLSNFTITDNLGGEDYLTYIEGSARLFINGTMREITPTDPSPLTFTIQDRLDKDAELILQYNALVDENISTEVDEITNHVHVRGYACGDCGCDNRRESVEEDAEYTIPKCEFAEVLITKAVSNDNLCCGEELDYMLTLTNIGNIDAQNVVVTDSLPANFTTTEIHMENNGNHYQFDSSEYTIDAVNLLTLPNETGTQILVPALAPGVDNTTRIRIHGHM